MKSKRVSFGYEDTDQKIEVDIYGLVFEINKKNIVDKDLKDINEDEDTIEREIREVIGEDSIEKINNKRLKDGYDEMTLDVEIAVLTCIYKAYITATSGNMIDEVMNTNKELENKARNLDSEMNREQRRNYNRNNYRRNRNYRRY
ncbi:MAG: hypothetical protein ACLTXR_08245 [Clostridia bacterium]|jgi:hypothetical protein|nr:MAG TPA: hypothetical protein [Caudoviricetes sp.]